MPDRSVLFVTQTLFHDGACLDGGQESVAIDRLASGQPPLKLFQPGQQFVVTGDRLPQPGQLLQHRLRQGRRIGIEAGPDGAGRKPERLQRNDVLQPSQFALAIQTMTCSLTWEGSQAHAVTSAPATSAYRDPAMSRGSGMATRPCRYR